MTSPAEQLAAAKRSHPELFTPERLPWSDGITRQFKVTDPNRLTVTGPLALAANPLSASLRLVKFHPDDPLPDPGVTVASRHGLVVLGQRTDLGNLFGTVTFTARLIDERLRAALADLPARLTELGAADLNAIFTRFGDTFTVVFPPVAGTWNTPAGTGGVTTSLRGLLMPASRTRQQSAAGAGLPVPSFIALLPMGSVDLSVPGWHLTAGPLRYHPTGDAQDPGGAGLVWLVDLSAPGEVIRG